MARTPTEIYNALILEKEQQTQLAALDPNAGENAASLLADLTSGSKVAIWRLLFWVVAVALWIHESIFDRHKLEVEEIADHLITGTPRWYQEQAFLFQLGDALTWDGKNWNYAVVDPTKQIIKRSAVVEINDGTRLLKIKLAKLSAGLPVKLSPSEFAAVDYFFELKKFAGTNIDVISQDPDLLQLYLKVLYDPLILSATGESLATPGTFPVEDAINAFIQNINANNFNGTMYPDELIRIIRAVPGAVHADLEPSFGAETLQGFLPIDELLGYNPIAGYMNIDPATPLSSSVTYVSS